MKNEGMPSLEGLKKMQEDIDTVLKLAITPQKHKNIDIDGTNCLVQLYEDKVTVVFPTKDLTIQYYDDVEKEYTELKMVELVNETLKEELFKSSIENYKLKEYNNLPWYKRLKRWQSK